MKKILLMAVAALLCVSVNAQKEPKAAVSPQMEKPVSASMQVKRDMFRMEAPKQATAKRMGPVGKKLTLDASKIQPVTHAKSQKATQKAQKALRTNSKLSSQALKSLKPTKNVKAGSMSKAPAFRDTYTGLGTNYETKNDTTWTMIPTTANLIDSETGEETGEQVNIFVDLIPLTGYLKEGLARIYPNGLPIEYTIDEDGLITIMPQAIASTDDGEGNTIYITLFGATSDEEDGVINLQLADDGLLKVTNSNWIIIGAFQGVEYSVDEFDDVYLGYEEFFTYVRYRYEGQKYGLTSEQDYNAHGVDLYTNQAASWIMQRGTWTEDGEDYPVYVNLTPPEEMYAGIYPDGIYVDYVQEGNTVTIEPQVIATLQGDDGETEYLMLFSGTSNDGKIVFTVDEKGTITTIDDETVMIAAWSTRQFDPEFGDTYLGWYTYIDRVKYLLPDAPPEAPTDVAFEPEELVLFAGLGITGYSYLSNLGVMGAYAPTKFLNRTLDIATDFEWSATEYLDDDVENTLTGNDYNSFTIDAIGGGMYADLQLIGRNKTEEAEPYTYGYGHSLNSQGAIQYEDAYFYSGRGESSFQFTDGSHATMTRQNPDGDLTFYTNWGTPDIYESTSICKIYSYQGKPATPLFITGITLPMVGFNAQDDFNLHISIYKCSVSASGRLTLGDLIAQSDATVENVNLDNTETSGLAAVIFDELYVEDEDGMSESLEYLFIDDEFVIVIEGWDNGTFSGVLGSQDITDGQSTSTWFARTGHETEMRSYVSWFPHLFIGLNDATYGYLHTEDNTDLAVGQNGGEVSIHVDPMYYNVDENDEPTYLLYVESVTENGEEADEVPEWIEIGVANEDYSTATGIDEDGEEYEYFVNGIDYDLVFNVAPMPEGTTSRTAKIVFMQPGALLTVTVTQGEGGILPGDADGSGKIDITDVTYIIDSINNNPSDNFNAAAADANNDGKVDITDVTLIIDLINSAKK